MKVQTTLLLVTTFLVVYWQAAFDGLRQLLGAQPDLLPSLVVYAALANGFWVTAVTSIAGGLMFDSLSANPLGASCLPLFLAGFVICGAREIVVRDQPFAQAILGAAAAFLSTACSLLVLLSSGTPPHVGWGTLWQIVVICVGAGAATPVWFIIFEWLQQLLAHQRLRETSFRSDREIRRGR